MKQLMVGMSMAMILAACGKSDDPSADSGGGDGSGDSSGAGSNDGAKPWDDVKKPFLSEQKMGNFVASLKDANTPFGVFESGMTGFNTESKLKEFDAAVRKHGFKDGEEYLAVWSRIIAAQTQVMQNESSEAMIKAQEESIKNAQEALKKPDTTPEAKQIFEQHIKGAQQSIEAYKKMNMTHVNEQDIAVYKKHKAEFEAAFNERKKK